jgi:TatD DNase family protein
VSKIELFDTHCHIHETEYKLDPDQVIKDGKKAGVTRAICVGTNLEESLNAINFVAERQGFWSSIGLHPHFADNYVGDQQKLDLFSSMITKPKVVAVGECGLDFFYNNSSKANQEKLLHYQIRLALSNNLPLIFHVRNAFKDFWSIFDQYKNIKGVIHSFSAGQQELDEILARGLYVGLNGIMTFTKNPEQLQAAKKVPLSKLLIETDAPYLTPAPYRGTICQLMHVRVIAEFLSNARGESLELFSDSTTANALNLFELNRGTK